MNAELFIIKSTLQSKNIWQKIKLVVGLLLENGKIYYDEYRFFFLLFCLCAFTLIFLSIFKEVYSTKTTQKIYAQQNDVFIHNDPYVNVSFPIFCNAQMKWVFCIVCSKVPNMASQPYDVEFFLRSFLNEIKSKEKFHTVG